LNGQVWVDMSKEQVFSHGAVKTEYGRILSSLAMIDDEGHYVVDGVLLSHVLADFSHVPDGVFFSTESLRTGRATLIRGGRRGYVELEGTPDMVLEVLSDRSVRKDLVRLKELYWKAGILEYWVVDARNEKLRFDILRHTEDGYVATRKQDGWVKSAVFSKSFKLTITVTGLGHPRYELLAG